MKCPRCDSGRVNDIPQQSYARKCAACMHEWIEIPVGDPVGDPVGASSGELFGLINEVERLGMHWKNRALKAEARVKELEAKSE